MKIIETFDELEQLAINVLNSEPDKSRLTAKDLSIIYNYVSDKLRKKWKRGAYSPVKKLLLFIPFIHKMNVKRNMKMMANLQETNNVRDDFLMHIAEYRGVYGLLSDDKSKHIFINLIAGKILNDNRYPLTLFEKDEMQYNFCLNTRGGTTFFVESDEAFVDCGAYIGDTLLDFAEKGHLPKKYYAFEPDSKLFALLQANVNKYSRDIDLSLFCKGVSNCTASVAFEMGDSGGKIVDSTRTNYEVHVVPIDDVIHEPVSLIKMDVEGSEYEALEGAALQIRENSPKLAISIYHKSDDFRKIPLLIYQINPDYKNYYIRHHSYGFHETVLYVC